MLDSYLGEITIFCGTYPIRGWLFCHGQELKVEQNKLLFNVLGNAYGGQPGVTFKLPDLRGAAPLGFGAAPDLSSYPIGASGGGDVVLTIDTMPGHTHSFYGGEAEAKSNTPEGGFFASANGRTAPPRYKAAAPDTKTFAEFDAEFMTETGKAAPVPTKQPYVPVNYLICVEGEYPHRP
jgi:microcystin-dependent protein